MSKAVVKADVGPGLQFVARGKVRDIFAVDDNTLLFIATDRISAFDVILENGIPNKGELLNFLSAFWFGKLTDSIPSLKTHMVTLSLPESVPADLRPALENRSMQVRKYKIFPVEAIVRGYITGSAWKEYKAKGTVHGIALPEGLQESQELPTGALYTPSTKAEAGQHDENIHPDKAAEIVGEKYAKRIEELALKLYSTARDYARERGIIIADTKFEFGLDEAADEIILVDEVLTPDSSRFWAASTYEIGKSQDSFDKQPLRDWLTSNKLNGKEGVAMSDEIVAKTNAKYQEVFEKLVGQPFENVVKAKALFTAQPTA